MKVSWR